MGSTQKAYLVGLRFTDAFLHNKGKMLHQHKDYDSLKTQMMASIFSNEVYFLTKVYTLLVQVYTMLLHT